jgi:hypothetical protein
MLMACKKTKAKASGSPDENLEEVPDTFSITAVCPGESVKSVVPPMKKKLVTWYQVATNPPLTKELTDDLSHLISSFLQANGYGDGYARVVLDHEMYERQEIDMRKWLPVRRGESYEGRLKMYEGGGGPEAS